MSDRESGDEQPQQPGKSSIGMKKTLHTDMYVPHLVLVKFHGFQVTKSQLFRSSKMVGVFEVRPSPSLSRSGYR